MSDSITPEDALVCGLPPGAPLWRHSGPRPVGPCYFLKVSEINVTVVLDHATLPVRQYPVEGFAPPLVLRVRLENGACVTARVDGKSYRKSVRRMISILDAGDTPFIVLEGKLGSKSRLFLARILVNVLQPPSPKMLTQPSAVEHEVSAV